MPALLTETDEYIALETDDPVTLRYKISNIEDQILDTLRADTTNFGDAMVDTYAGQVSPQLFLQPEYMQGFINLLPFALVSYQGKTLTMTTEQSRRQKP